MPIGGNHLLLACAGVGGLLLGSFLNVLVYRWPRMLMRQWHEEVQAFVIDFSGAPANFSSDKGFNLAFPASHCPQCLHGLSWYENIPLISFVVQRGQCRNCKTPIGWHYPLIEFLSAMILVWVTFHWGFSGKAFVWCIFLLSLMVLSVIDWQTQYLPDQGTQPLLWVGLLSSLLGCTDLAIADAVIGAMVGYLILWSIATLFQIITGREGMGHGDFKLMAALGAWLGWQVLPGMVVVASLGGSIVGLLMRSGHRTIAFGPFLCLSGVIAWMRPSLMTIPI